MSDWEKARRTSSPAVSEIARVQEGVGVGGIPSLQLLPRFMGLNTDSLSLSTKLINSLRVQPDKLLIN